MSATNRGSKRHDQDFYATPPWCTRALLNNMELSWVKTILEPCSGDDAIVNVIKDELPNVGTIITNDIREETPADTHLDFIDTGWREYQNQKIDMILTNPPYRYAIQFIEKSLMVSNIVVMLLRVNFLGSKARYEFWRRGLLDFIYVLHTRPSFNNKGTDATEYGWFVFKGDHDCRVPAGLKVI